jgi:hypothetical protein
LEERSVPSTFQVTNLSDSNTSGSGSLRDAITQANTAGGTNIITFSASGTILLNGGFGSLPAITNNLTIQGPGSSILTVQRPSANPQNFVIITINAGSTVAISGLTITGGNNTSSDGGAIENLGVLTLSDCVLTGNTVSNSSRPTYGGAIDNQGALSVDQCTFSNNKALSTYAGNPYGYGGAIANRYNSAHDHLVVISRSTLQNNSATLGGVIDSYGIVQINGSTLNGNSSLSNGGALENRVGAQLTVVDSTITGNTAANKGGGVRNLGTLQIVNSTISGNKATTLYGGGISQEPNNGSNDLRNTIVANNTAPTGPDVQSSAGRPITANYSFIGTTSGATISGANNLNGNPQLGTLQNNGGPTSTMALQSTSGAIDNGNNAFLGVASEVQTVTIGGLLSGTFTLVFHGQSTSALAFNASAAQVQTALNGLSTIAGRGGSVSVTQAGSVYTVTFGGFFADLDVAQMNAATSGGPTAVVATTTNGMNVPNTDQRGTGFNRTINGTVDIGAYEFQPPATTTTLGSSLNPSLSGQSVTFTATVTANATGSSTVLGTVTFMDGSSPLSTVTLDSSGVATLSTSSLSTGTHSITAVYNGFTQGDYSFTSSTSSAVNQLVQANTNTTLTSSPNPSISGQAVTFTATVSAVAPGTGTPTGTVTFMEGTTTLASGTLNGAGTATFTTSSLSVGSHTIMAVYAGDGVYLTSTSAALTQTVFPAIVVSPSSLPAGQAGTPYSQTITTSGGTGSGFTFAVNSGALPPGLTLTPGGLLSGTPTTSGNFAFGVTATDSGGFTGFQGYTITVAGMHYYAIGASAGGGPEVKVYDAASGALKLDFFAYDVNFTGGVRVAVADINGDGAPDIVTGAGPGGGPHVKVFDGTTGTAIQSFFAYDVAFKGGVYVAAGDVNADGFADIVTGAGPGGGPHVKAFDGLTHAVLASFFAYDSAFSGGVSVAAGDVRGIGRADIVTGAGAGGGPQVKIFDGASLSLIATYYAYDAGFQGGVFVATGDLFGAGHAQVIVGAGPGGGPHVKVLDAMSGNTLATFFAYDMAFAGGVQVGAVDLNDSGHLKILTGPGQGGGPDFKIYQAPENKVLDEFFALNPAFVDGIFVAGN